MRRPGKLTNVIGEMKKAGLNILGLSEVRWKDAGEFMSEGVRVIYTGGEESQNGIAILLDEKVARCVDGVERYGDRLIMVTIRAHPVNIVIMQVYMPTTAHEEDEVDSIYKKIEERLEGIKGKEYVIVMEDWNASVGEGGQEKCVGQYGLGKKNERGDKLIEFCNGQELLITNTCFQLEKRRIYTWKAPGDGARYQLDYIMVRQRYRNSVKISRALPGADADTDHNLVAMTVHLQLKFTRKKKAVMKRWDRENLKTKSKELSDKIEEHLEERELMSTEERWNRLKKVVKEAAVETVDYQMGSAPCKPWVTTGMIQEIEERRKWKHQSTDEAKSEYRRLNNKLRKTTDKAREKWWEEQCEDLEELQAKGRHDAVYSGGSRIF